MLILLFISQLFANDLKPIVETFHKLKKEASPIPTKPIYFRDYDRNARVFHYRSDEELRKIRSQLIYAPYDFKFVKITSDKDLEEINYKLVLSAYKNYLARKNISPEDFFSAIGIKMTFDRASKYLSEIDAEKKKAIFTSCKKDPKGMLKGLRMLVDEFSMHTVGDDHIGGLHLVNRSKFEELIRSIPIQSLKVLKILKNLDKDKLELLNIKPIEKKMLLEGILSEIKRFRNLSKDIFDFIKFYKIKYKSETVPGIDTLRIDEYEFISRIDEIIQEYIKVSKDLKISKQDKKDFQFHLVNNQDKAEIKNLERIILKIKKGDFEFKGKLLSDIARKYYELRLARDELIRNIQNLKKLKTDS